MRDKIDPDSLFNLRGQAPKLDPMFQMPLPPSSRVVGGEPTPSRPEASSTTTDALPLSYGSPRADLAYSAAASNHAVGSEERGIGIGMAIAAGIIIRSWGQEVYAREILGSAGLDTLEKLKASGVDQYDIDALMSVVATATEAAANEADHQRHHFHGRQLDGPCCPDGYETEWQGLLPHSRRHSLRA